MNHSTTFTAPPGKNVAGKSGLGKYREVLLAVAFFLVLDLAVLVLNFYTSFQFAEDATAINLAGRQRMLSQRMAKSVYALESTFSAGNRLDVAALDEFKTTLVLFDQTLAAFDRGGLVLGGAGRPVQISALTSEVGRGLIQQARPVWEDYREAVQPLMNDVIQAKTLDVAVVAARNSNFKLLTLMNDLTTHLEQMADRKAQRLRWIQTVGILLALVNFGFILFNLILKLRENDRKIESARQETAEILATVQEGLFLLDVKGRIGSQYSASLPAVLGRSVTAGDHFLHLLQHMVSNATYQAAQDFLELLFANRVKAELLQELNPLLEVEIETIAPDGNPGVRFLSMRFNRIGHHHDVQHVLVTVSDITTQVALERKLTQTRQKSRAEVTMTLDVLKISQPVLTQFLLSAEKTMLEINDLLRNTGNQQLDYHDLVDAIFRKVHTLKGEAATLGLEIFEELAQQFETVLLPLRAQQKVSGDDLMRIPMPLDGILERISAVRGLLARLSNYQYDSLIATDAQTFCNQLRQLAHRIAADHGKQVLLQTDLTLLDTLPVALRKEVKDICVQLLRNAIVHGIESAQERHLLSKNQTGLIQLSLNAQEDVFELQFRDDGIGISPEKVRAALIQAGVYTERQLQELDDRSVLLKIFEPGVSTATTHSRDAGHGVGMDVVRQKIQQLGASLRVATCPNMYTQFSISFNV